MTCHTVLYTLYYLHTHIHTTYMYVINTTYYYYTTPVKDSEKFLGNVDVVRKIYLQLVETRVSEDVSDHPLSITVVLGRSPRLSPIRPHGTFLIPTQKSD